MRATHAIAMCARVGSNATLRAHARRRKRASTDLFQKVSKKHGKTRARFADGASDVVDMRRFGAHNPDHVSKETFLMAMKKATRKKARRGGRKGARRKASKKAGRKGARRKTGGRKKKGRRKKAASA